MVLKFRSSYLNVPRVLTNFGIGPLAHVPEKWEPVFRTEHAQNRKSRAHHDSTQSGCALAAVPAARTALAARAAGSRQRLVHEPADGACAAPALGAAAEAAIDLSGGARRSFSAERRAYVVVGQHVARTDDHENPAFPARFLVHYATIDIGSRPGRQNQKHDFIGIPICAKSAGRAGGQPPPAHEVGNGARRRPGSNGAQAALVSASTMPSTTSSTSILSSPSPMTRITGSVPDERTISRP